jgi:hypothetical protein
MAGIWDEDLNAPVTEMPPPATGRPAKPLGQAMPAVPYVPGTFSEDLAPPPVKIAAPPAADTRPFLTRADEAAGDAIRGFTNAVTFGNMDRIAGGMNYLTGRGGPQNLSDLVTGVRPPQSYEEGVNQQVKLSEEAQKRSPYATLGGELVGGVALPGFGAEALATRWGNTALNTAREARNARLAAYGTVGAATGAAQGAGNTYTGNAADYGVNALIGGAFGGVLGSALGGAVGPRPRVSAAKTPTTDETYAARDFAYDKLRANPAWYENPYLADVGDKVARDTAHYTPTDIPATRHAIDRLRASIEVPGGGNTPAEIESIRAGINAIPKGPERAADRRAGYEVKKAINEFYANPPLGAVRVGDKPFAADAAETADLARKLHGAGRRGETFDNILHNAELATNRPGGTGSYADHVWSGVRGLETADRPGAMPKLAGYSDAEKAALERIAYPGFGQRALRTAGTMLGGGTHGAINPVTLAAGGAGTGGAIASYLGADPTTGAVMGAAGPLAGLAMRSGSNRMALKAIKDAYDIIHQSNPLYDYRVLTSGTKSGGGLPPTTNDAVRNAIAATIVKRNPQLLPPITVDEEQR